MSDGLTELIFATDDLVAGRPLSPETVDLPSLRGFLAEVETLIKGDVPGASLADSRVRIETGSLKVVAMVGHLLAVDVREDLAKLERTGDLDSIQPKRAQVIETWQARARRSLSRVYQIQPDAAGPMLRITQASQFLHAGENAWVSIEKYLAGKVTDLGGKQEPNVHLLLTDTGRTVKVAASEQQLASERENQIYKHVVLRVRGEQHLRTKDLRNLQLIQFLPQAASVDEEALTSLWEKGRKAWKDVKSAAGWVEALRGNP